MRMEGHFGENSPERNPAKLVKNPQIRAGVRAVVGYDSRRAVGAKRWRDVAALRERRRPVGGWRSRCRLAAGGCARFAHRAERVVSVFARGAGGGAQRPAERAAAAARRVVASARWSITA